MASPREPRTPDIELASRASPHFTLKNIAFLELSGRQLSACDGSELSFEFPCVRVKWAHIGEHYSAIAPFIFELSVGPDDEKTRFAEVRIALKLDYVLDPDAIDVTADEIESFVGLMAFMHGYPYVRAELQNLTAKLGLPPLLLPLMVSGAAARHVQVCPIAHDSNPPPCKAEVAKLSDGHERGNG